MIYVVVISILFFFLFWNYSYGWESAIFQGGEFGWSCLRSEVREFGQCWSYGVDPSEGDGDKAVNILRAGLVLSGCDFTRSFVSHGLCRSCGCHQWWGGLSQPTAPHQPWHHHTFVAGRWARHSGHWHDPHPSHWEPPVLPPRTQLPQARYM